MNSKIKETQESQNVEWKESWRDEHLKWVCGFANAQGGRIYIGKNDMGNVVGLHKPKKLMNDLPNKISSLLGVTPQVNLFNENNKPYIEIAVEPSMAPISYRGDYYFRSGSVNKELTGHALTDFLLRKTGVSWDRLIQEKADIEDIDDEAIEIFKKDASGAKRIPDVPSLADLSTADILNKLMLLTPEGLTNAALILFAKNPDKFYSELHVKIGRFSNGGSDLHFQEECEGNLIKMRKNIIEQLDKKFLVRPIRFEEYLRIEELEYPEDALREMILNALVHRNYLVNSMTQIRVHDHGLSIWNAGLLPETLSIENLYEEHQSVPRNPLIADVCFKAGYIEKWGYGMKKITDSCREAKMPIPRITERNGGILLELRKGTTKDLQENLTIKREPIESLENGSDKVLEVLRGDPSMSIRKVAESLGVPKRTVERHLATLRAKNRIRRMGPARGRGGFWEIIDD